MAPQTSPIQPADDGARALARGLIRRARTATLAFTHPDTGFPFLSLIGFGTAPDGTTLCFLSKIALHSRALAAHPDAALMLGEPGPRGDPLNSARFTLSVRARPVDANEAKEKGLHQHWLAQHPKAKLYIGFPDFSFVAFTVTGGFLNGGFGRAFALGPADLL